MTQTLFQTFGGLTLPVGAGDVTDTLTPLDPVRDTLTALFKQALISELGAAWTAVVTGTQLAGKDIVASTLPLEPTPEHMTVLHKDLPVLCVYRKGTAPIDQVTFGTDRIVQQWGVDYILPPVGPETERKIADVLPAVAKVIRLTAARGGHPDYAGTIEGVVDRGDGFRIRASNFQVGRARFAQSDTAETPTYLACSVTLETWELSDYRDGFATDYLGGTFSFDVGDGEGLVPDLIQADTETEPNLL